MVFTLDKEVIVEVIQTDPDFMKCCKRDSAYQPKGSKGVLIEAPNYVVHDDILYKKFMGYGKVQLACPIGSSKDTSDLGTSLTSTCFEVSHNDNMSEFVG